jgi:UDP-glucose:(heptosyl)LPS alpha-1,3-glucosyltransferase
LLHFKQIELRSDKMIKMRRMQHDYEAGNRALAEEAARFDIVHSQHYPCSHAGVVTFHNHTVRRWSQVGSPSEKIINDCKSALVPAYRLRDQQDEELCKNGKCLIFPSHVMQEDYFETYPFLNAGPTPYVVAYPGSSLPATISGTTAQPAADPKPFTFLFIGRGFRRKGLDIVLAAAARLVHAGRDLRVLIAGMKGKPSDALRLRLLGLTGKVEYLGFRNDMDRVYAMAQAAVLPSRVEPFGMAPLQAMSFGLVPIVSRVSGVSEVLTAEADCLILENHLDAAELASHMARLMDEPQLLQRLRGNVASTATKISWEQTVQQTLDAYAVASGSATTHQAAVQ